MEKGRIILDDRERKRIKSNWNKIDMPLSLMCYSTFVTVKIGKSPMPATITDVSKDGIQVQLDTGMVVKVQLENLRLARSKR